MMRRRRQLLAIAGLACLATAVGVYVLAHQRLRFPWEDTYTISAELRTGQALTPGQGQVVAVAGVTVGEISRVRLRDGRALVDLEIDRGRLEAVHADATVLVRPKTGLQDMAIQLDPGSEDSRPLRDGDVIPVGRTEPNVNLDEILAALDADARAYVRILLSAGGRGLDGRGDDLRAVLRAGAPTLERSRRVARALAGRDRLLRRLVHHLRVLAGAAAEHDLELARLVDAGSATLRTVAEHDRALRASLRALPATLEAARGVLDESTPFAARLKPALERLSPTADDLTEVLPRVDPLLRDATPAARRLRGLVGDALPAARTLDPTLRDLRAVTPALRGAFDVLNRVVDELGHNPDGPEEGYLFWLAWFAHNAASLLSTEDAHGPVWRGALLVSCSSYAALEDLSPLLAGLTAAPVCPDDATAREATR